jgi:hypothetical protein
VFFEKDTDDKDREDGWQQDGHQTWEVVEMPAKEGK